MEENEESYSDKARQALIMDNKQFIKHDQDKNDLSLITPKFIFGLGKALTHGAIKYEKNNWKLNKDINRFKASAYRHFLSYLDGELIDEDSGLPHLDLLSANIMFLRYFEHEKDT